MSAPQIRAVTVYCSSSPNLHEDYVREAATLGRSIAQSQRDVVYGGGARGLMGEVAKSARDAGGRVVGIITERLRAVEQMDPDNHENIVVPTMRERKKLLEARGDAFVVLPGGVGTLEEFFDLGLDSVMAVELAERLRGAVGRSLPATVAFDHPNLTALTSWLLGELELATVEALLAQVNTAVTEKREAILLRVQRRTAPPAFVPVRLR